MAKTRIVATLMAMGLALAACGDKDAQPAKPVTSSSTTITLVGVGDCSNKQTQLELNDCAADNLKLSDTQLNEVYKQVINSLSGAEKDALVAEEKAWIAQRDKKCISETAEYKGGSIYPMMYDQCVDNETRERIKVLIARIK